eukprot:621695-Amphidinium_carterae.1
MMVLLMASEGLLTLQDKHGNTSEHQTLHCDAAVITVPIGVLQSSHDGIAFNPPLPRWKEDTRGT